MENYPTAYLFILFFLSVVIIWLAGISLAKTTDTLDSRFKVGDALGGLVLLGIAGSLPEIAIVYTAAKAGHIPVIIGNIIGGMAIQVLVISIFDLAVRGKKPLSYLAGSKLLSLEAVFVIAITLLAIGGAFIPAETNFQSLNPFSILILAGWIIGLYLINKARKNPLLTRVASGAYPGREDDERRRKENHPFYARNSTLHVIIIFLFACVATLLAGVLIEKTGVLIASNLGISSGIFAATVFALISSLPEISIGLESIKIGDNQLAISDVFGGRAFTPVLFIMADLVAKKPVLSYMGSTDLLFAFLAIAMTAVYGYSFVRKIQTRHFRLGMDSVLEIVLYIAALFVLRYIS